MVLLPQSGLFPLLVIPDVFAPVLTAALLGLARPNPVF